MVWFERVGSINAPFELLVQELQDLPKFSRNVVRHIHGLSKVELVSADQDYIEIRTNEGLMRRDHLQLDIQENRITHQYQQTYVIGRWTTITSHVSQDYWREKNQIRFRYCVEELQGTGVLGWLFQKLARAYSGHSFFNAAQNYLEEKSKEFSL